MGRLFQAYLSKANVWCCQTCGAHLAYHDNIICDTFNGKHGTAFLIRNVINISQGESEERKLMTGTHKVADISCNVCNHVLGWKYLHAHDKDQKYKENKFLVEKAKIIKSKH